MDVFWEWGLSLDRINTVIFQYSDANTLNDIYTKAKTKRIIATVVPTMDQSVIQSL